MKLPQIYVVVSKSAKVPTYKLSPQNPKESFWIVYEVLLNFWAPSKPLRGSPKQKKGVDSSKQSLAKGS